MGRKIKDKIGIRYGLWIVKKFVGRNWDGCILWFCKCDCGNEVTVRSNNLQSGISKSCGCLKQEILNRRTGENNPAYIHGKYSKEIEGLKEKIRKRDNHTCQNCGRTQEEELKCVGHKLSVHHIDEDDTNNVESNMTTLCKSCHNKIRKEIN